MLFIVQIKVRLIKKPERHNRKEAHMSMDKNLPANAVEQEEAQHIIRKFAENFKDVAYTDPVNGKTGFTATTLDDHFVVSFGWDDTNPSRPGWYYSVAAAEDYAHSAKGSGMEHAEQAEHLVMKVISGETWYKKHKKGVEENKEEQLRHEIKEGGVISTHRDADGDYDVLSAG